MALLAFALGVLTAASADEPKSVAVMVSTPWAASDPAVEAATFIWQDGGAAALQRFWTAWAAAPAPVAATSYQQLVRRALAASDPSSGGAAHQPIDSLTLSQRALAASLATRSASPTVEFWHQLSGLAVEALGARTEAACWPVACGRLHSSVHAAIEALGATECTSSAAAAAAEHPALDETLLPHEPTIGGGEGVDTAGGGELIVFLNPHAADFSNAWGEVIAAAAGSRVRLRYRPASTTGRGSRVSVGGFGAELVV